MAKQGDNVSNDAPQAPEPQDTAADALTGSGSQQMARFRAPGPGVMGLESGQEGALAVNDETDALVEKGLLERLDG